MFNKVKQYIENSIDNGYEPLAMTARELAEDLIEKTGEFAEDTVEAVTETVEQVKQQFDKGDLAMERLSAWAIPVEEDDENE